MSVSMTTTPVVMSLSSNDPTGGSGIAASIETLASLGCHCLPIVSSVSVRDTKEFKDSQITPASILIEQVRAILEDISVNLISIGDLASISNVEAVHTILRDYPELPVVLHPDISQQNNRDNLANVLTTLLLPQADIVVLSKNDVWALAPGADTLAAGAQELMEHGCSNFLLTDSCNADSQVYNHWFSAHSSVQTYTWDRLPNSFHGARSTLAAALSAYLAHELSLAESILQAQQFTWQALQNGRRIGMGKWLPDRMHWCKK